MRKVRAITTQGMQESPPTEEEREIGILQFIKSMANMRKKSTKPNVL